MKTLKVIVWQMLVCLSISCYAQPLSFTAEKYKATDNFIISITNPVAGKLTFLIKDKTGKHLLQESYMFVEKVRKVIYLGSLQPDDYTIEINNGEETRSSAIKVDGIDKTVHPESGKALIVGFSKLKSDNSIDIIVQNKLDKNVSLKIYKAKSLVSSEDLGNGADLIKKILKLDQTGKGDFIVKVGTKENIYQYKITL